jgi:Zn-dependent protease with chaperone function
MIPVKVRLFALVCFLLLLFSFSPGQPNAAPSSAPPTAQSASLSAQSTSQSVITEYSPPPENARKSAAYSAAHYHHYFVNTLYGWLVLLVVLHRRVAAKYRDWAERVSSRRIVELILYAPVLLLTVAVLSLPSDLWDQSLQRRFGLSVQSWKSWTSDWVIGQIISLIIGTILVGILYAVIRRSTRRWWFYFWLASIPILLIVFFVQPVIIDPLFFKFTPLQAKHADLVASMEQVVHHGGMEIPPDRMFEMNASTKMTGLNAYVTGFGASKRAVVWDTTLQKATTDETLFVFGHEMGHYVLLHIPKEITIDAFILLVVLYAGYRLSQWALASRGARWGIRGLDDFASLPLLMLLLSVLTFFATPAFFAVSRYFEHEADRYGLEVIHGIVPNQAQVAAHYFEKSGEINLADPNPSTFIRIWMFDHPTRPERVSFVATYDPWGKGEGPRYVK